MMSKNFVDESIVEKYLQKKPEKGTSTRRRNDGIEYLYKDGG